MVLNVRQFEAANPEFVERVKQTHRPPTRFDYEAPRFSSDAVEAMSPDEYKYTLHHTAQIQRGVPENAMLQLQRVSRGGIYAHAAEHVGDLTHRLNEEGGSFGDEYVAPKVRGVLRSLEHPYGFEREHQEQMASNQTDMDALRQAGETYSAAHEAVPVYNRPSYQARSAAVYLGHSQFSDATRSLRALRRTLDEPDQFRQQMSQAGSVAFLRKQEELFR